MKNKNWKLRYFALKVNKSILPVVFCWLSLSAKVSEKSDNERMSFSHEGFWGCCGSPANVLFAVQNRHSSRAVRLLCSITDLTKILQYPNRSYKLFGNFVIKSARSEQNMSLKGLCKKVHHLRSLVFQKNTSTI